jgi:RecA/RadA recombinase
MTLPYYSDDPVERWCIQHENDPDDVQVPAHLRPRQPKPSKPAPSPAPALRADPAPDLPATVAVSRSGSSSYEEPPAPPDPDPLRVHKPADPVYVDAVDDLMGGPLDFATLCRAMADRPAARRLSIGFSTLDKATRGGIPEGRIVVLNGAPGASKTGLAVQWAHTWATSGACVVYLAADMDPEDVMTRIGQREGFERDALDGLMGPEARRGAWHELADRGVPLLVLDGAAVGLERAILILRTMPGDGPRVLVVDSLQWAQCGAAAGIETARGQMDAKLGVLRRARASGVLVVALSEMNRGGYAHGAASPTSTLAASKESGAIEYAADLLLGLRSGAEDLVDLDVAKDRLGSARGMGLRLRQDRSRATLAEVDRPEPASQANRSEERRVRAVEAAERDARDAVPRVVQALAAAAEKGCSLRMLRTAVAGVRAVVVDAAASLAVKQGEAVTRPARGHDRYYLPSAAPLPCPGVSGRVPAVSRTR